MATTPSRSTRSIVSVETWCRITSETKPVMSLIYLFVAPLLILAGCNPVDESVIPDGISVSSHQSLVDSPLIHDFGYVPAEGSVHHEFVISNDSTSTWEITEAKVSCSCTVPQISRSIVPVGETVQIAVTYTASRSSFNDTRTISLLFADPAVAPIILTIQAKVREPFVVVPGVFGTQTIAEGSSKELAFAVENYFDKEAGDLDVQSTDNWLSISVSPPTLLGQDDGPMRRWKVLAVFDAANLKAGTHRTVLRLRGGAFFKEFPLELQVSSPVFAVPGQLFFGNVKLGKPITKTVIIRFSEGAAPVDVEAVATIDAPPSLEIQVKALDDVWNLSATLLALPEGDERSEVVITFVDTKLPVIRLPIYAFEKEQ